MKKKISLIFIGVFCVIFILTISPPIFAQETKEKTSIDILSMGFGGSGYVASFGLSELINKKSSWLRATCIETGGSVENIKTLLTEPNRRKNTIIYSSYIAPYLSSKGLHPFQKKYESVKALSLAMNIMAFLSTLDPNIKNGKDLEGKRIGFPPRSSIGYLNQQLVMQYTWKVWDSAKKEFLGWSDCISALRDGMVDAAVTNPIIAGEKVLPNSAMTELLSGTKKTYFISITEQDLETARKATGYPLPKSIICPPKSLSPKQTEKIEGGRAVNGWWADSELPDEIAYEICRIIYENYKEFWTYHASLKGLVPSVMAAAAKDESQFHPGAVKFYKERCQDEESF